MFRRSACLTLAATAALASAGLVRAGETNGLSLNHPIYADDAAAAAPPPKPLMGTLDQLGPGKTLENEGINITGYVEGGWTYNFDTPNNHTNVGRVFDFEDQDKTLNQVELMVSRAVDATKGKFDVGFTIDMMYGGDARLIHSSGMNIYGPEDALHGGDFDFDEEFDLTQANVVLALPVGGGLTLTLGKFVTLMGYETINPTTNLFYSHSFMFGFAIPFTNTGAMAKYNINDKTSLTIGLVRGWEQSTKDNNGSPSGMGQLAYTVNDKCNVLINIICGPEQDNDTGHYRTVVDVIGAYKLGDNTTIGINADYGYGSRQGNDVGFDGKPGTGDWWGGAFYFSQRLDPHFTFNVCAEYFNDDDGCRGLDTGVAELTAGVSIYPNPDNRYTSGLVIRPEIRWDHASNDIFNDGNDDNQFTVGGDIIFAF